MTAVLDWNAAGDAELVRATVAGDQDAFAAIYDRYADRLHDFCVGMLRDRDAAADCVQDAFVKAAQTLSRLREPDRLRSWLYAIARNETLDVIKARRREQPTEEVPEMPSTAPDLATLAAHNELAELIAAAAGGLSDRDRTVLDLAYRHGLDGPELADALEVSHDSAKKMVQRMRGTVEHALGAVLVSRRALNRAHECPELASVLHGWDGDFTVLMRKRIVRHIESCPVCDAERQRVINPAALLGAVPVFLPAPLWLRDRTLQAIHLPAPLETTGGTGQSTTRIHTAENARTADGAPVTADPGTRGFWPRAKLPAALLGAAVLIATAISVASVHLRKVDVSPANNTRSSTATPAPGPAVNSMTPSTATDTPTPTLTSAMTSAAPATSVVAPANTPSTVPAVTLPQTIPTTTTPLQPIPPTPPPSVTTTQSAPVFSAPVTSVQTPEPPSTSGAPAPAPSSGFTPPRRPVNTSVMITPTHPVIQ